MSLNQRPRLRGKRKPKPPELSEEEYNFITNKWSHTIIQPILIAIMVSAFFTALLGVITLFSPHPEWYQLIPLIFVVVLEGVYTHHWLSHPERRTLNHTYYQISELAIILLAARIYTWAIGGHWPEPRFLAEYLRYPWILFDDGLFIIAAAIAILAWLGGRSLSHTFNEIALDASEVSYYSQPTNKRAYGNLPIIQNRHLLLQQFYARWIWGGVFVVVCVSMISIDLPGVLYRDIQVGLTQLRLPPIMIGAVLLYFLSGLALLSEAQLETLNARWLYDGVQKAPAIERKWHQFGIWFLLIVGTVAAFLPLGSTLLIGRILERVVLAITAVFSLLSYLLILLYSMFLSFLMAGPQATPEATAVPTPLPTPAMRPTPVPTVPPIVDDTPALLLSSFFWTLFFVGLAAAFLYFIRGRGTTINIRLLLTTIITALRHFFADLFGNVAEQIEDLGDAIQTRFRSREDKKDEEGKGKRPFRFFRLNALSPEEQVRYFYLSTVKRAQEKGVKRADNETPLEFMADLKESWPEAEAEIDLLTDAFLKARYSPQPIAKEELNPIKAKWKRAKARLRKRAQKTES